MNCVVPRYSAANPGKAHSFASGLLRLVVLVGVAAPASMLSAGENVWTTHGPAVTGMRAPAPTRVDALAIDPSSPRTVYAGAGDGSSDSGGGDSGVFKSPDGGLTWSSSSVSLDGLLVNAVVIDPLTPSNLYAGTFDWEGEGGVYQSTDGGTNWTAMVHEQNGVLALAIDPSNPGTLYSGTIFRGVVKTTGGGDWVVLNMGLTESSVQALAIDPSRSTTIYAGTSDHAWKSGGVIRSDDGGAIWTAVNAGLPDRPVLALAIDPVAPATLYAGTRGTGIFKSTDRGGSWTSVNVGLTNADVRALAIDPRASSTLYAGTAGGGVFRSANGGVTWTAINDGLANFFVNALAIDPLNPARLYAGTDAGVYEYLREEANCVPGAAVLCLNNGRFRVTTEWTTLSGQRGVGQAISLTENTGYFTFFDPSSVEVVVKVLDGCGFNSRYWVFAAGLTDVSVVLTVTDTRTGAVKTYVNPQGTPFRPIQDTGAFGGGCPP